MRVKAVLFDFGGTLDADGAAWPQRFYPIYGRHGIEASWDSFLRAFYRSDHDLPIRHALRGLGLEQTLRLQVQGVLEILAPGRPQAGPAIAHAFLKESRSYVRRNLPLLERLRRSCRLGIVSNFYGNIESVLESEGLGRLFHSVADSGAVGRAKPDARIFLQALEGLGASPAEAVMVGDSLSRDMKGAEGLGMRHAYLRGGQAEETCCKAAWVLETLADLEQHLPPSTERNASDQALGEEMPPSMNVGKAAPVARGMRPWHAGVIAAGDGLRLRAASNGLPKPMVPVAGRPLIHWTVSALRAAGARSLTVLLNSRGDSARDYLLREFQDIDWTFLRQDTASSWESFRIVCRELAGRSDRWLMSTVDALVRPADAARFASAVCEEAEGALALTSFIEDESPLWADIDGGFVTALGPAARRRELVTCGLYALSRSLAPTLDGSHARLRDYWTALVQDKRRIAAVTLGKTVDVDRPEDLATAEAFLRLARAGGRAPQEAA